MPRTAWMAMLMVLTAVSACTSPEKQDAGAALAECQASNALRFQMPVDGKIIGHSTKGGKPSDGIVIQSTRGAVVKAADAGYVESAGPAALIMVHTAEYKALYACLTDVLVKKGDSVVVGQPIAKVGACGDTPEGALYFIVRLKGKVVDPLPLLPSQ